jgi:hypothetical protein
MLGKTLMQLVTAEVCFFGCMEFVHLCHLYDHRVGPLVASDKVSFTKGLHKVAQTRGFCFSSFHEVGCQKHFSIGFQFPSEQPWG